MTLTQIILIGRPLILPKTATKDKEGQMIFETRNKFAPLLMENIDDFTTCKLTNITSANSKKPDQNLLFSNNSKSVNRFERKRRPDICVFENQALI